jgi:FlaA1/EpsC-like NDP-sugar epimerase
MSYNAESDRDSTDNESLGDIQSVYSASTPKVVLVTGAAGFIGSHVGDVLLERGDRVNKPHSLTH